MHNKSVSGRTTSTLIESEINLVGALHYYDEEVLEADFMLVWESAVRPLTYAQRIIFFVLVTAVVIVAILGNLLVLYVNFSRRQRLLFRTCLISLAISDLIYTVSTSSIVLPKMVISASALWILGPLACALLPFFQTMSVLVNSILLVCIALDRYMAVVRIVKGTWEPGKMFCITCCVLIWGMSAAVSSPMFTIYDHHIVYIVPVPEENSTLTYYTGYVCASNKSENAYYFSIIFSFIFAPLLITFLWLNTVVAREIWSRRTLQFLETPSTSVSSDSNSQHQIARKDSSKVAERKRRLERLFKVIICLMSVFFICRLPGWIHTIYRLNNDAANTIHWVLHYALGTLCLLNCALNPYLYTFMSETIKILTFLRSIILSIFNPCKCKSEDHS